MNYTLIILGVILIVVIYMMYSAILGQQSKIGTSIMTLAPGTSNPTVAYSTLATPNSPRYNLSFWVSIESLKADTNLFDIRDNSATAKILLSVKINTAATLTYNIAKGDLTATTNHTIMSNFPLQKWVFVCLSLDSSVMDMYIDGKLIRSEKLIETPAIPTKDFSIKFSDPGTGTVIYIARFERNPVQMDPATAWSKYMAGNGGNYFSSLFSSYGAAFSITKDNLEVNKLSLF
jgi:hypothetical protein